MSACYDLQNTYINTEILKTAKKGQAPNNMLLTWDRHTQKVAGLNYFKGTNPSQNSGQWCNSTT